MLNNYQQQAAEVHPDPADQSFATVGAVYADGLSLIFDGESAATGKHYKCNAAIKFSAGQRVRIVKDSGTYVVEYPVGNPITTLHADTADSATSATKHTGDTLGFFGTAPIARVDGVASVSSNATLAQLIASYNSLIAALDYRGYGLIS